MARKSSFSDAFTQSFSSSVDRHNRKIDQIEQEKRAEARRKDEVIDERLYKEDQKYLDRGYDAEVVAKQNEVLDDRVALNNQRAIAKELTAGFSNYGLDPGTFTKDDGTMYEYAAQRELMEAKNQAEAGTAAGYSDSATPFVKVPGGAPDERFFRAMERVGESQQAKAGEAKASADTAEQIRLKPFFARASGRWKTGGIPSEIPIGTSAEGLAYEKFFNEEDLKARTNIGSQANIAESDARAANLHFAKLREHISTAEGTPSFVFDGINDPDPKKALSALQLAEKNIAWVPGAHNLETNVRTDGRYVYRAPSPRLRPPGSANPNTGSAGVSDSSPAMGGGPFASSSFRPLSDLPLATDPLRVSRLDSPTPELGKPTPLRQAIGEAMFRDKMSSAQQAEAYNTLGDEAASFYEDFAGEASRKLSRQQSSLDKAIGRDQSDRELLLTPKRFRSTNAAIPGAIMPRTPMEEIEFAKKLADLDTRSNVNLGSFYDLIRRQRNLRPPPPLIK